jgi:peptidoglycan/xylan/chitin deacetylase (PgdA/CDA1 family)
MTRSQRLKALRLAGVLAAVAHCGVLGIVRADPPQTGALEAPHPPHLKVLPWGGHKAALTLTFDDTSPSEANEALPALDEESVKATFFVTAKNAKGYSQTWARAEREGHELGNHTVDHCHAAGLGRRGCLSATQELAECNHYIESRLGAPDVYSFAYPFVDQSAAYKTVASGKFLLARAGSGGLVDAAGTPDWYAMDARFIEPTRGETVKDWDRWIDETDAESKWLVLVFHSILPEVWCEGVSKAELQAIIEHAKAADDVWIDTFVSVGAYLRAQRMLEAITPVSQGNDLVWRWVLPHHFPHGRSLSVVVDGGTLAQGGVALPRGRGDSRLVALDAGSLAWSR